MLTQRIIGAFTFRKGVYEEVEQDADFTRTAWLIVIVVAFLDQLGSFATGNIARWFGGAIIATIMAVIGFAVAAAIVSWVGLSVYKADVTFDELVRTLGLAYVWRIVGFLGVLTAPFGFLNCLVAPLYILAFILGLVAWFVAAKEALDLEWGPTIITVILGWLAFLVIMLITGVVLGILGFTGGLIGGAFG